jgi:hypothetical protein
MMLEKSHLYISQFIFVKKEAFNTSKRAFFEQEQKL